MLGIHIGEVICAFNIAEPEYIKDTKSISETRNLQSKPAGVLVTMKKIAKSPHPVVFSICLFCILFNYFYELDKLI
jgi:hypothetical protein